MLDLAAIKAFCQIAHDERGQRYGAYPYYFHLTLVAQIARKYGFIKDYFQAACFGHDLLEDTNKTLEDLQDVGFPDESILLIQLVTNEPGANRKERIERTYPKIAKSKEAVALKLCDRLANVIFCKHSQNLSLTGMYRREYSGFRQALFNAEHTELQPLWEALDRVME